VSRALRPTQIAGCLLVIAALGSAVAFAAGAGPFGAVVHYPRAAKRPIPGGALSSRKRSSSFRFFSRTSVWNAPLAQDAALDPGSGALIGAFEQEVLMEGPNNRLNVNTTAYSIPIYTVPAGQPTVRVRLDKGAGSSRNPLQGAWRAVPLPPGAQPAKGSDKHLVVWQPSTDRMWEFWAFENTASGPVAQWGGAMHKVSKNPGVYNLLAWRRTTGSRKAWEKNVGSWGATATSLPAVGGLITLEDLQRGRIDHALAMAIPNARANEWTSPAHRTDGTSPLPSSLPEGAHLRLDPRLDLASLGLPHLILMMAEAAQRYGIIIRDKSASITFYAQDPTPTGANPYTGPAGYFEGKCVCKLLTAFPWSHLELLKMKLHSRPGRSVRSR
jgi:hypothetical protein